MKVKKTKVEDLKLDTKNARKHNRRNLDAIKLSLEKFGQQKPIVVTAEGTVVAGNGTAVVAKELGWETINTVTTSLDGDEQTAFAIADNRTGELAQWDVEQLSKSLTLFEEELRHACGFEDYELQPLLAADWTPDKIDDDFDAGDQTGGGIHSKGTSLNITPEQRISFNSAKETLEVMRQCSFSDGEALEELSLIYIVQAEEKMKEAETKDA